MHFSELELISKIKKHNRYAFEILIRQYSKSIYLLTYNILNVCGTKEDMEECVSDVFIEVWQKINQFNPQRGNFKTWILMLTKYKALSYKRALSTMHMDNIEDYQIEIGDDVVQQVIERETQEQLIEIINSLSILDRELFIRRYYLEESIQDLMHSFGLSRSAVDNRLLRIRKTIKEVLTYE
jgi:RNA polymerase sigma-70 factor (ECF subfamily)